MGKLYYKPVSIQISSYFRYAGRRGRKSLHGWISSIYGRHENHCYHDNIVTPWNQHPGCQGPCRLASQSLYLGTPLPSRFWKSEATFVWGAWGDLLDGSQRGRTSHHGSMSSIFLGPRAELQKASFTSSAELDFFQIFRQICPVFRQILSLNMKLEIT